MGLHVPMVKFEDAFKSGLEAHPNGPLYDVLLVACDELGVDHKPRMYGDDQTRKKVHNLGELLQCSPMFQANPHMTMQLRIEPQGTKLILTHAVYGERVVDFLVHHDQFLDALDAEIDHYMSACDRQLVPTMVFTPACITHEGKIFTDVKVFGHRFDTVGLILNDAAKTVASLSMPSGWSADTKFVSKLTQSLADSMALLPSELPVDTNNLSAFGRLKFEESFMVFKSKRSKYWNRPNKISGKNMPELRPMLMGVFKGSKKLVFIGRIADDGGKYFLMEPVRNSSGWKSYTPVQEDGKPVILKDDGFVDNHMQKAIDKARDPIKDAQERKRGH